MPILFQRHEQEPAVTIDFGVGDVGFRTGMVDNYQTENDKEKRLVFLFHNLDKEYGAGASIGNNSEEAFEKFVDEVPPLAFTFPADNPTSLDTLITALTSMRQQVYNKKYYAVVYKQNRYEDLKDNFTICESLEEAQAKKDWLYKECNDDIHPLYIVEVFGTQEDFVQGEDYLKIKPGRTLKVGQL